jgi:hypothetical protein
VLQRHFCGRAGDKRGIAQHRKLLLRRRSWAARHRRAAGLAISGVFDLGALRDSPHVNDKVKLSEEEIQKLSPMRRPIVNKPLGIAYGTGVCRPWSRAVAITTLTGHRGMSQAT